MKPREQEWLARENDHEERLAVIQRYYQQAHEEEDRKADEARRKNFRQITADVNRDTCKSEREKLAAKGLVRGRRFATKI
jgi:hypothetical protein